MRPCYHQLEFLLSVVMLQNVGNIHFLIQNNENHVSQVVVSFFDQQCQVPSCFFVVSQKNVVNLVLLWCSLFFLKAARLPAVWILLMFVILQNAGNSCLGVRRWIWSRSSMDLRFYLHILIYI